jgi:hypothetical protein
VSWQLHQSQPPLSESERTMLLETLRRFDGVRFDLLAALVMGAQVYVLVTPYPDYLLERAVQSWKTWGARQLRLGGRMAPFWRRGFQDRIMRSAAESGLRIRQLAELPGRQWPGIVEYEWLWVRGEPPAQRERNGEDRMEMTACPTPSPSAASAPPASP